MIHWSQSSLKELKFLPENPKEILCTYFLLLLNNWFHTKNAEGWQTSSREDSSGHKWAVSLCLCGRRHTKTSLWSAFWGQTRGHEAAGGHSPLTESPSTAEIDLSARWGRKRNISTWISVQTVAAAWASRQTPVTRAHRLEHRLFQETGSYEWTSRKLSSYLSCMVTSTSKSTEDLPFRWEVQCISWLFLCDFINKTTELQADLIKW